MSIVKHIKEHAKLGFPSNGLVPVYSVINYGADPTGTSDSRTAIQAALDAADAAGGGTVYIPTGTYILTKTANWSAGRKTSFGQVTAADAAHCLEVDNVNDVELVLAPGAWLKIADTQQTGNATTGTIVHLLVGLDVQRFSIRGPGSELCGFDGNKQGQTSWTGGHAQQQHGCLIFFQTSTAGAGNGVNKISFSGFSTGNCWSNPMNIFGGTGDTDPINGRITCHDVMGYDFGEGIQFAGFYDVQLTSISQEIRYDRNIQFQATDTVTMTIASPCVVTHSAHGMRTGYPIRIATTDALPTGLTAASGLTTGTTYFIERIDNDSYYLHSSFANATAASPAATRINTSGTQSGTHTAQELGILYNGGDGLEFSGCDQVTLKGYTMRGQTKGTGLDIFGCKNFFATGMNYHEGGSSVSISDGNGNRHSDNVVLDGLIINGVVDNGTGILINCSGKVDLANVGMINTPTPVQVLNGVATSPGKPVNLFNFGVTTPKSAVIINTTRRVSVKGGVVDAAINDPWNILGAANVLFDGHRVVTTGNRPMHCTAAATGMILDCEFQGGGYPLHVSGSGAWTGVVVKNIQATAPTTNEWTNVSAYDYLVFNASVDQTSLTGVGSAGELHTLLVPSKNQMIELRFTGNVTVAHNSAAAGATIKFKLAGAVNFAATADDRLLLRYDGTNWVEMARSVN